MQPVFEAARMYTAPVPEVDLNTVFTVTTFELGSRKLTPCVSVRRNANRCGVR